MRRVTTVLLAVVLLIAGAAVGAVFLADEQVRDEVEMQVSASLKETVPFTVRPQVDIAGTPLAWHLFTRRFPSVRVRGAEMPVALPDGSTLPLLNVDATLTDVVQGDADLTAERLTGSGRVTYADLSRLSGVTMTHDGGDRVRIARQLDVIGLKMDASLTGVPRVDTTGAITLRDTELEVAGVDLPPRTSQAIIDRFVDPIALPLPYGLKVTSAGPGPDGIVATVEASDVTFPLR